MPRKRRRRPSRPGKRSSGGGDFSKVAEKSSSDPSKDRGGDLGFFSKDEMVPQFAEAAFKMKPGEMTDTPVKTQFGWHVIKVEEHRVAPPPKFEEVKEEVRSDVAETKVRRIVTDLRSKAQIKLFNADGSPALDKPVPAPAKK
ncbi:MAG: peptidylprolyl isomerase [Alphaproteobacteria bacterium]